MEKIARPIAIESRMLAGGGTGVGTYATALRDAVATLTDTPLILSDRVPTEAPSPPHPASCACLICRRSRSTR